MLDRKIFKKYDIRGIYPAAINEETVQQVTRTALKIFGRGAVVIGYDARLSSPSLYLALKKELAKHSKLKILEMDLTTTPAFYFTVIDQKARGGIMITASHNPKEYNGLKIVGKKAAMIGGEQILKIMDGGKNHGQ